VKMAMNAVPPAARRMPVSIVRRSSMVRPPS